jgi:hypothetical protein
MTIVAVTTLMVLNGVAGETCNLVQDRLGNGDLSLSIARKVMDADLI